jgi:hypothetical protein
VHFKQKMFAEIDTPPQPHNDHAHKLSLMARWVTKEEHGSSDSGLRTQLSTLVSRTTTAFSAEEALKALSKPQQPPAFVPFLSKRDQLLKTLKQVGLVCRYNRDLANTSKAISEIRAHLIDKWESKQAARFLAISNIFCGAQRAALEELLRVKFMPQEEQLQRAVSWLCDAAVLAKELGQHEVVVFVVCLWKALSQKRDVAPTELLHTYLDVVVSAIRRVGKAQAPATTSAPAASQEGVYNSDDDKPIRPKTSKEHTKRQIRAPVLAGTTAFKEIAAKRTYDSEDDDTPVRLRDRCSKEDCVKAKRNKMRLDSDDEDPEPQQIQPTRVRRKPTQTRKTLRMGVSWWPQSFGASSGSETASESTNSDDEWFVNDGSDLD